MAVPMMSTLTQCYSVSERISIEPLSRRHAKVLLGAVNQHRDSLSGYLPWTESVTNINGALSYISERIGSKAVDSYWFAIVLNGNFTGVVGTKGVNQTTKCIEVGYWLTPYGRGQNVIDQILDVLIPFIRQKGNAKSVQFHCMEDNIASINIAERAGAKLKEYVDHDFDMLDRAQRLGIYELPLTEG